MTNKKVSDLTATTTFSGTDLLMTVQGGVSKKITATDFGSALSVASATTSVAGIAQLATNAEAATGTNTTKIITPDDMRYGLANGTATKILVNGATGTFNTGDVNITGSFRVNGTALGGSPTATPVSFSSATTVTMTVDFTTYAAYKVIVAFTSIGAGGITLAGSSNGGGAYTNVTAIQNRIATTTVTSQTEIGNSGVGTGNAVLTFDLMQQTTSSGLYGTSMFSVEDDVRNYFGGIRIGLSAACNRLRLSLGSSTGYYMAVPIATR